jgi:hypothetical protein
MLARQNPSLLRNIIQMPRQTSKKSITPLYIHTSKDSIQNNIAQERENDFSQREKKFQP